MRERKNVVQSHIAAVDARWGLFLSLCHVVLWWYPLRLPVCFFLYYLQIEAIIEANSQTLGPRWFLVTRENPRHGNDFEKALSTASSSLRQFKQLERQGNDSWWFGCWDMLDYFMIPNTI